jgi:RING finger protein 113A
MSNTVEPPTVPFFKKKSRPANARQRSPSSTSAAPSNNGASTSSDVVRPTLKASANPLIQGTKRTFSQRERDEDDGPDVKWKAAGANPREAAELQLEILEGEEAAEILKKAKRDMERDEDDTPDDGLYKGQAGYKNHIKKREMVEVPKAMRIGPQRSSNTIKTVTLVDYQPDVCKDYKGASFSDLSIPYQVLTSYFRRNRVLWFR